MTNYDYYKEEIEKCLLENGHAHFGIKDGKPAKCLTISCGECEIYKKGGACHKLRKEWLNAEYKEPITVETLFSNFRKFCEKGYFCGDCEFNPTTCKFSWLLENYNVSKKETNENDERR